MQPLPARMPVEMKREWMGVAIPKWLRVFDCRVAEEDLFKPLGGRWRPGAEAAEYAMELGPDRTSHPVGMHCYSDARRMSDAELTRVIGEMVAAARQSMRRYRLACKHPANPGDGGGIAYAIVGAALSNYGWTVIADTSTRVTYAYERGVFYP